MFFWEIIFFIKLNFFLRLVGLVRGKEGKGKGDDICKGFFI